MKKIGLLLFLLGCTLFGYGQSDRTQVNKVVVLDVVDKTGDIDYSVKTMLRSYISASISKIYSYEGDDRVDMSKVANGESFHRTGMMADAQVKQLCKSKGASYVMVVEAVKVDANNISLTMKLMDGETARIKRLEKVTSRIASSRLQQTCDKTVGKMLVELAILESANDIPVMIEEEEVLEEDESIFIFVEQQPEFVGGESAMHKFICSNMKYPQFAKDNMIEGKVYVQFVVEKDGSLSNIKTMRDIGCGCGMEAMRLVKMMPKWKPGMQGGKPVRAQYTLPITFEIK